MGSLSKKQLSDRAYYARLIADPARIAARRKQNREARQPSCERTEEERLADNYKADLRWWNLSEKERRHRLDRRNALKRIRWAANSLLRTKRNTRRRRQHAADKAFREDHKLFSQIRRAA
jgi:hypothetical protein